MWRVVEFLLFSLPPDYFSHSPSPVLSSSSNILLDQFYFFVVIPRFLPLLFPRQIVGQDGRQAGKQTVANKAFTRQRDTHSNWVGFIRQFCFARLQFWQRSVVLVSVSVTSALALFEHVSICTLPSFTLFCWPDLILSIHSCSCYSFIGRRRRCLTYSIVTDEELSVGHSVCPFADSPARQCV